CGGAAWSYVLQGFTFRHGRAPGDGRLDEATHGGEDHRFCVDHEHADGMSHCVPFSHAVVTRDGGSLTSIYISGIDTAVIGQDERRISRSGDTMTDGRYGFEAVLAIRPSTDPGEERWQKR